MSEHAPTDWQLSSLTPGLLICRHNGEQVKIDAIDDNLAYFILHAVKDYQKTAAIRNSHAKLVEALKATQCELDALKLLGHKLASYDKVRIQTQTALAHAKGE